MKTPFLTPRAAENWRAANPTPAPVAPPEAHFSPAALGWALTLLGAVVLGLIGSLL